MHFFTIFAYEWNSSCVVGHEKVTLTHAFNKSIPTCYITSLSLKEDIIIVTRLHVNDYELKNQAFVI